MNYKLPETSRDDQDSAERLMNELKDKNQDRALLVAALEMWFKIKKQGVDINKVEGFGFDANLMNQEDLRAAGFYKYRHGNTRNRSNPFDWPVINGVCTPKKYNYVVMQDGTKVKLSPMVDRPEDTINSTGQGKETS